jgi:hypothetical protein
MRKSAASYKSISAFLASFFGRDAERLEGCVAQTEDQNMFVSSFKRYVENNIARTSHLREETDGFLCFNIDKYLIRL